jgi:hypothetical protein
MAAIAAAGLVMTPIAAQANTRAGDSAKVYSVSNAQPGVGRATEGEGIVGAGVGIGELFALFMVGMWVTGIVVVAADIEFSDNQTAGAN